MTYDNTTLTKLVSRPVRKYYIHKKMSPLRLSANKFRPIVSPYGFQAGRDLYRATPSWHMTSLIFCSLVTLYDNGGVLSPYSKPNHHGIKMVRNAQCLVIFVKLISTGQANDGNQMLLVKTIMSCRYLCIHLGLWYYICILQPCLDVILCQFRKYTTGFYTGITFSILFGVCIS